MVNESQEDSPVKLAPNTNGSAMVSCVIIDANDGNTDADFAISRDPLLSSDLASFPISTSLSRQADMQEESSGALRGDESGSEYDPLLGEAHRQKRRKPFYRARPMWIVPFAILASIARGMTIAPRVEVFTQLSCNAVYKGPIDYNHTRSEPSNLSNSHSFPATYLHSSEDFDIVSIQQLKSPEDGGSDDNDNDPMHVPSKRCLSDPVVQAGAAKLQTIMTTTMGTLSALTTGWWGHFGERHGRVTVLMASTIGLLLTDFTFILVSMPNSPFSGHGHKLLIVAPIIEGLLGGWSALQSATTAYISDCTSDGSRAHIFSRFTGVFFLGFATGPMFGAYVLTHPPKIPFLYSGDAGQSVTPVFWVAVLCSFVNFLLAVFVFPESLTKEKRKARKELALAEQNRVAAEGMVPVKKSEGLTGILKRLATPMAVFAPRMRRQANGKMQKDWNLTFLALASFGYLLSSGIFQIKYLYAEHVFEWGAEQLSYYITFVGGARAVHLLFILPMIISFYKPKIFLTSINGKKAKPTKEQLEHEMRFDLVVSRLSFVIDILSHTLVSLSSTSQTLGAQLAFVGFTVLSCFGSGVQPSLQSLALCILQSDAAEEDRVVETGPLFGAFAVLQATGQMILGPMIFGLIYGTTVAKYPKAIFTFAASTLFVSVALLSLVQDHATQNDSSRVAKKKRNTVDINGEVERGRSRVSKDLTGASSSSGNGYNTHQ